MGYKRKRIYALKTKSTRARRFKKTRFSKRRSGGPRTTVFSSRSLNPRNVQRKGGRKLSKRAYKNLLWRNTITMSKFKSAQNDQFTVTTPVGIVTKRIRVIRALSSGAGQEFYRFGGGLQDQNFGIAPNFGADISSVIVRGGLITCNVANNALSVDPVIVTVELRRMKQQVSNTADTASSNTGNDWLVAIAAVDRPLMWTFDDAPDSAEYISKTYLSKTMVINPNQMLSVSHKLKVEKWDTAAFERGDWSYQWIVYASQVVDAAGVGEVCQIVTGHDMSFCVSSDAT